MSVKPTAHLQLGSVAITARTRGPFNENGCAPLFLTRQEDQAFAGETSGPTILIAGQWRRDQDGDLINNWGRRSLAQILRSGPFERRTERLRAERYSVTRTVIGETGLSAAGRSAAMTCSLSTHDKVSRPATTTAERGHLGSWGREHQ